MIKNISRYIRNFHFKSIQSSIAAAFSGLILSTILVVAILSYKLSADAIAKNSSDYTYQLIQQINVNIESYIIYMENISQMVLYNEDVRTYIATPSFAGTKEKEELEQKIFGQFNSILSARKDISNIIVFGANGRVLLNKRYLKLNEYASPTEQIWYRKALEARGKAVISSSHVQNVVQDDYRWVVSLSRQLAWGNHGGDNGVLLVDLNYSVINDMCSKIKLGKKGYIFIVDDEGNIIYHPQQQLIYSNLKSEKIEEVLNTKSGSFITQEGKESRMYTIKESGYTGWKTVGVAYMDELVANQRTIQTYYFIGAITLLTVAILFSFFISSRISRPVKQLEVSMMEVEKGNFDIKVNIESTDEIGELSRAFNIMTEKIKELVEQNIKEQELKRKSELKALQAQINPHFLYNTLDSIIWMAESKMSEEVVLMASALAKLFRLSISRGEEIITIQNEIEHIKSYLTIQKMRYLDKLDFEIHVEEGIQQCRVLKILLQPLVENSIYHGIKNKTGVGLIQITAKRVEDKILFQVIDNGTGMPQEVLERIFDKKENKGKGSGVGVRNVNERIKLYFGDAYGLSYESEPDKGTTVYVRLPVIE